MWIRDEIDTRVLLRENILLVVLQWLLLWTTNDRCTSLQLLICKWCSVVVSVSLQLWLLRGVLLQSTTRRRCSNERSICYEFNLEEKTKRDAEISCRSRHNGQLVTIIDGERQLYIQSLLRTSSGYLGYWTGGKLYMMHQWTWVNGVSYPSELYLCATTDTVRAHVYASIVSWSMNCE